MRNIEIPVRPETVYSPKDRIEPNSLVILYTKEGNSSFSIASLNWKSEGWNEYKQRIAIRWNSETGIGQPQSCGYPTWFILPTEIALSYAKEINNIEMITVINRVKE